MATPKNNHFKNLNRYSWSILVTFICATFAMSYHTAHVPFIDVFQTLLLILIAIYYGEKLAPLVNQPDPTLKKSEVYARDMFLLNYSFLLGCLFSLIFSYNNSDVKGWWSLIICFSTLYGLFFSVIFSALALIIKNHKRYTLVFSLFIIALLSMEKFLPDYTYVPLLGPIDPFFVITCSLLIFHCFFTIGYKIVRLL